LILLQAGWPSSHPASNVKALKNDSVPDWGQHAATMLPAMTGQEVSWWLYSYSP